MPAAQQGHIRDEFGSRRNDLVLGADAPAWVYSTAPLARADGKPVAPPQPDSAGTAMRLSDQQVNVIMGWLAVCAYMLLHVGCVFEAGGVLASVYLKHAQSSRLALDWVMLEVGKVTLARWLCHESVVFERKLKNSTDTAPPFPDQHLLLRVRLAVRSLSHIFLVWPGAAASCKQTVSRRRHRSVSRHGLPLRDHPCRHPCRRSTGTDPEGL